MSIQYSEASKTFKLDAKDTSYVIAIVDEEQFLAHVYYGSRIPDSDVTYLLGEHAGKFMPTQNNRDRLFFMDSLPQEYPTADIGDYRESCLQVISEKGHEACSVAYRSHRIYKGKPALPDMPATFGSEEDCTTLDITAVDTTLQLEVHLLYTVFEDLDVICRSVQIQNQSQASIQLTKVLSACVDFDRSDLDLITLYGGWARERSIDRRPVHHGRQGTESDRGESSHHYSPFMALMEHDANEDHGHVYGFNFVYSGNFIATAELDQYDHVRAVMGINPNHFSWKLNPGETFTAPEVVLVHSDSGLTKMTQTYHDLYRNHLIRGKYKDILRPVLINNWEATYFDFNTDKLLEIARQAAASGIEMLVMDDGWFANRFDDNRALGDWTVNEEKLPGGLAHLVEEVNKLGLKFGIWYEPEMISPDSELYRAHPDWAIQVPNRPITRARQQYVLDFSRKEVRDCIYDMMYKVLSSCNIEYVKWDMNRTLCNLGSSALSPDRQQELSHRYTLGVYDLMNRLTTDFPNILLENCSGGGARFDPGMLYYSPQIWTSDNTDAIARLAIQAGTALVYPLSTIDANVSAVPNHQTGRITPFKTRGHVAMCGTFGYQLDITTLPEEDLAMIPQQIDDYHRFNPLICSGDYYRLGNIFADHTWDSWMIISKDQSEALLTYVRVLASAGQGLQTKIRLKGLNPESYYAIEGTDEIHSGAVLMNGGLYLNLPNHDYVSEMIHLVRV